MRRIRVDVDVGATIVGDDNEYGGRMGGEGETGRAKGGERSQRTRVNL
jgi:hypothetical protein